MQACESFLRFRWAVPQSLPVHGDAVVEGQEVRHLGLSACGCDAGGRRSMCIRREITVISALFPRPAGQLVNRVRMGRVVAFLNTVSGHHSVFASRPQTGSSTRLEVPGTECLTPDKPCSALGQHDTSWFSPPIPVSLPRGFPGLV